MYFMGCTRLAWYTAAIFFLCRIDSVWIRQDNRPKILAVWMYLCFAFVFVFSFLLSYIFFYGLFFCSFSLSQLDKIVKEKETQFNEEKNNMWKELTEAFQKVVFFFIAVGRTNCCTVYYKLRCTSS